MPDSLTHNRRLRASRRQVSEWRKLQTKKGRIGRGQILLEGVRQVREAVLSHSKVLSLIISDDERGEKAWRQLTESANPGALKTYAVSSREFDQLADTVHAAGLACVMEWSSATFDANSARKGAFRVLVCDQIADPGNLGTLVRTAAGLGLDSVFLLPGTAELTNSKTIRSSAGAIFHIPIYEKVDLAGFAEWCDRQDIAILVADPHRGQPIGSFEVHERWAIVIGGETRGLDEQWVTTQAQWISLPLARNVESLNAAVAGTILMDRLCRIGEGNSGAKPT